jgi:hypothetical protein
MPKIKLLLVLPSNEKYSPKWMILSTCGCFLSFTSFESEIAYFHLVFHHCKLIK